MPPREWIPGDLFDAEDEDEEEYDWIPYHAERLRKSGRHPELCQSRHSA